MSPAGKRPAWLGTWRPLVTKAWFMACPVVDDQIIDAWNSRVSHDDIAWLLGEANGPVGRLHGRKYFVRDTRPIRVPLLGGPVFGRPVVAMAATADGPLPKGRQDWLLHGGSVTEGPVCDPQRRWLDVSAAIWGGPLAADEITTLVTGADEGAVPDIATWKTLHS